MSPTCVSLVTASTIAGVVALVIRNLRAIPFLYFNVRSWASAKKRKWLALVSYCRLLLVSWGCLIILIKNKKNLGFI